MPIVRVKKDPGDFFLMSKEPIEDPGLSWKAKGMLAYLMSKPNDWQIWVNDLVKRATDGRDAVLSGLTELISQRYAAREQPRREDGTLGPVEYVVYESPQTAFPYTVKPLTDKPYTDNPTHTNNDCTNNNQSNNEEEGDFLEQTKKPDRERIQDVLYDILRDGTPPPAPKQQQVFENAVDTLVLEFREIHGSKRLDHDLTSKIIAAIRAAYEEKGNAYPFQGNRSPNTPIIDCIVDAGIGVQDQATARSAWAEHAELSQAALAERQAEREEERGDPWWEGVLGKLKLQMTRGTFDSWLKPTRLLSRDGKRIVVGVANEYALDWLDNRLRGTVERAVAADGVQVVEFEIIAT